MWQSSGHLLTRSRWRTPPNSNVWDHSCTTGDMAVVERIMISDMVHRGPTCKCTCREYRGEGSTCRANDEVEIRRRSFGDAGFPPGQTTTFTPTVQDRCIGDIPILARATCAHWTECTTANGLATNARQTMGQLNSRSFLFASKIS